MDDGNFVLLAHNVYKIMPSIWNKISNFVKLTHYEIQNL